MVPDTPTRWRSTQLLSALRTRGVELVVLSGSVRKVGPVTVDSFANRILDVHPALLPRFGGQGMYGMRVHHAVLAAGVRVGGTSVQFVDAEYDQGPVVAQAETPVLDDDTPERLAGRVAAQQQSLFVDTVGRIAAGQTGLAPSLRS